MDESKMNRDDIIRMAREVGFDDYEQDGMLLHFAALVAAAEREACAKVCDNVVSNHGHVQSKYCSDFIRARGQE